MFLKKIILDGFKSFAEKTVFHFKPGFTVITGPNGCGKSNVVDAIKWTLGEQRAKSLRGKEMLDVVFGGNENRKPAEYAEVSMVFSVARGEIALEGNEVVITRRLTNKGESTYLINRQPSRLRDIRELFLDTGIGAAGYYVMEQGKIDYILNAGFQERRMVFEEAAGISKFKAQKKETLRKLERVDANLNRLLDILGELSSRLKGVRAQAGKARRYQEYHDEIHRMKIAQGAAQYKVYTDRQREIEEELEKFQEELKGLGDQSQEFEASLGEITHKRKEKEVLLDTYQKEALTLTEKLTHVEMTLENDKNLIEDMTSDRQRSEEEQKKNQKRIKEIEREIAEIDKELDREERRHKQLSELLKSKELELSTLEQESEDSLQTLEAKKTSIIDFLHLKTEIQNQLSSHTSRMRGLEVTKSRVDDRMQEALRKEQELLFQRDQREKSLREIQEEVDLLEQEEKFLKEEMEKNQAEEKSLAQEISRDIAQAAGLESRLEVLGQLSLEDVEEGLELLIKAKEQGEMKGIFDLLINHFQVDLEYALAIEAALDKFLYALVVEDEQVVQRALIFLQEKKGGKALLLPLKGAFLPAKRPELPSGVCSPLEVLEVKGPYEGLLECLLSDYGIVDSLENALALREKSKVHLVTRKGEIVYLHGPVQLGSSNKEKKSILAQRSELMELQRTYEELQKGLKKKEDRLQNLRNLLKTHDSHLEETKRELASRRLEQIRVQADLRQVEERLLEQRAFQEGCSMEWEEANNEYLELEGKVKKLDEDLKENQKLAAKTEKEIEQMEKKLQGAQAKQRSHHEKITSLKIELTSAANHLESMQNTRERLEEEVEDRRFRDSSNEQEKKSLANRKATLQEKIRINSEIMEDSQKRLSFLEANIEALEEERHGFLQQEEKLKSQGESSFNRFQKISEKVSSLKVQQSKIEVRLEDLLEKVKESLDVDLPEAIEGMDLTGIVLEEVDQKVMDLSAKLRKLGNVNFEALEELEELEDRYEGLKKQEEDLIQSKESLVEIIGHLDKESKDRFEATFSAIREHFQRLFRKLFGGGKADIVLEAGVDILEAGIDIIAKPPGKEPRSITLLSGGEKTMTTVALSFAIFQFKPSPFCVLDEVDAALDENNIGRFLGMLQDFVENCQFIIISHSRQTISAAHVIYGVTMEESGVSKNLSLELKQVEEKVTLT